MAFRNPYLFVGLQSQKDGNPLSIQTEVELRDLFAACALAGLLAHEMMVPLPEKASAISYLYADAMLDERQKGGAS